VSWGDKKKQTTTVGTTGAAHFNPGQFSSGLTEDWYAKGWGGQALNAKQAKLVAWLRKKHSTDKAAMNLADRLDGCKANHRCHSAACIMCSRAAKAFATKVIAKFLANHPDNSKIVCVTVVPVDGEIAKGKLSADQHKRNVRRWKEALGRADVTWFLGATDWSFNEHDGGRYKPSWQHHYFGFTATDDPMQLKKELKKQFPKTDAIPRPVKVTAWNEDKAAIEYMIKPVFWRRIGTDEAKRFHKDSSETRECRATDKQPLRKAQKHELLLHLDKIGIQGRLLMRWLQIIHVGGMGCTVVNRPPKGRVPGNGGSA
jgi:hypothetical protein